MKKKFIGIIVSLSLIAAAFTSCNQQMFDTNYTFNKAIINFGGKTIVVDVEKWNDYEGEQIQIITTDGTVMVVSSYTCILVNGSGNIINQLIQEDT